MRYLITYNPDSEYLQHFNPNHDKKGRFTFSRGEIRKFQKYEKNDNNARFAGQVLTNKKIKEFNANSKELQELKSASSSRRSISKEIAKRADEIAVKKLLTESELFTYENGDFFDKERMISRIFADETKRNKYYDIVKNVVYKDPKIKKMAADADKRVSDSFNAYKKAAKEFVDKSLGSYADVETKNISRTIRDEHTNERRQQTLSESIANQMIINAMVFKQF